MVVLTPAAHENPLALFGAGEGRNRLRCGGCGRRDEACGSRISLMGGNCRCGRWTYLCFGCHMLQDGPRCTPAAHDEADVRKREIDAMNERILARLPVRQLFYFQSASQWPESIVGQQCVEPVELATPALAEPAA